MRFSDVSLNVQNETTFESVERLTGLSTSSFVQQFETLGCDCEFGLVQRRCGAEPLGLLRFAFIRIDLMVRGLKCDFAGLDDPLQLRAIVRNGTDWDMHQRAYNMYWHTFLFTKDVTEADLIRSQARRLSFLREKILRDLREGEKIFVVWRTEKNLSKFEVEPLYDAIRAQGTASLLFITRDDPPGSVTEIRPGLLHGRIDSWTRLTESLDPHENCAGWLRLMVNAWLLRQGGGREISDEEQLSMFGPAYDEIDPTLLLQEAGSLEREGHLESALATLESLMTKLPEAERPWVQTSRVLLSLGRAEEAAELARRGVEQSPRDVGRRRHLGLSLLRSGRFQEAESEFRKCIAENPESGELYDLLSIPLERLGQLDDALLAAQEAARIDGSRNARLAQLYLAGGRLSEAEAAIKQALAARDDSALAHHLLSVISERQGRSTEALEAARRAAEVSPNDPTWKKRLLDLTARAATERAQAAQGRGDFAEAAQSWEQVRNALPERTTGYVQGALALRQLRRFDDAEKLIVEALQRFQNDAATLIESARIAQAKGDLREAGARWDQVILHLPASSAGYVGKASVLRTAEQFEEADALCSRAIQRLPDDHAALVEYAWIAHQAANWPEASRRWDKLREVAPHLLIAYTAAVVACWSQDRFDAAETVLQQAMEHFPDQSAPFARFAETAARQNHWSEALRRWIEVTERFPSDPEHALHMHWTQVARTRVLEADEPVAERATNSADLETPIVPDAASTARKSEPDMREVMLAFESLGGHLDGSEFGDLQRAFSAEPLSLLRWAEMTAEQLISVLDARFEGVGEPEQTEAFLQDDHDRNEYHVRDKRFGVMMHASAHEEGITHGELLTQSRRRLKYLKSTLLDDLESARKIFVYRSPSEILTDGQLDRMHSAIREYGDTTLLYVRPETEAKEHGTVEIVRPGLMVGYIDQFSTLRAADGLPDTSLSWTPVYLNAYKLWQKESASYSADPSSRDYVTDSEEDRHPPGEQPIMRSNWRGLLQRLRRVAMPSATGAKAPEPR